VSRQRMHTVLATAGAVLVAFVVPTQAEAAPTVKEAREIRVLYTSELGLDRPAGVTYASNDDRLLVLDENGAISEVVRATRAWDDSGKLDVPIQIDGTAAAFDASRQRLTSLVGGQLVSVPVGGSSVGPSAVERIDATPLGVQEPAGITFYPTGTMSVLDKADGEIVILPAGAKLSAARHVPLGGFDASNLVGLAYNPQDRLTYVADPSVGRLYGVNAGGTHMTTYDIGEVGIANLEAMTFAPTADPTDDPAAYDLFMADAGKGETLGSVVQVSLTAAELAAAATVTATLVQTIDTSKWNPASPDPAGISYIPSTGRLLVSDSEVNEMSIYAGVNLWQATLLGAVQATSTTVGYSNEPTGVGYNPGDGRMYISDDDADRIYIVSPGPDGQLWTSDDTVTNFSVRSVGNKDSEGVDVDTSTGNLYVVDGVNAEVYQYTAGGAYLGQFDIGTYGARDPEGIAYDEVSDHLFVVDESSRTIYELTNAGALVNVIDIQSLNSETAAGLTIAPASDGSGARHLYIVDRGIDNDSDPTENDGKIYEVAANLTPSGTNTAPSVDAGADQTITLPDSASLNGSVTDDGLPDPPAAVTTTWSMVSGPGTVTFGDASALSTTAAFSTDGTYVLRLTADDGELTASDDLTVTVLPEGSGGGGTVQTVEVPVASSSDDAEERVSTGAVDLTSSDLELTFDGSSSSSRQAVGMRFAGVTVPQGATITKAYVQFQVDEATTGTCSLTIQAQAADNPATFTTATGDITSRPLTTASVAWNPPGWPTVGARGADQQTPDLKTVIQAVVNRGGWASGNAIAMIVNGTGKRTAEAIDGSQPGRPLLHIEYSS
jgi:uncharacterized protein YjiK